MSDWYADRLRDEAGAMEAKIAELKAELAIKRDHLAALDCEREALSGSIERLVGEIFALEQQVDNLDDDIHAEDPEYV